MAEAASPARATAAPQPVGFTERVLRTEQCTATITELWLQPLATPLDYLPGEYVLLEDRDGVISTPAYSLADGLRPDGPIPLLIKRVHHGQASGWVHDRLRTAVERASQRRRR